MCIGIPLQIVEQREFSALCRGRGSGPVQEVNTLLIGPQPVGTWVLNFLGSAREVLSEIDARRIDDGLRALEAVMRGESIDVDEYFSDLADPDRPPGRVWGGVDEAGS
ncbi:MAG: HypC/HybG/HupF family hydrogenase formation chaperone [Candidatus Sedimenticola endophacoides]